MGNPFVRCPKCGQWQIDGEYKEYIMWNPFDYIKYFVSIFSAAIILGAVGGALLWVITKNENEIIFIIPFGIISILLLYNGFKNFKEEKIDSIKRTQDEEYLDQLFNSKLISQKKYNEFISLYNIKGKKRKK